LGHHFDFQPQVDESLWLAARYPLRRIGAATDCRSASRLAEASGCGAELDAGKIPLADTARQLALEPATVARHLTMPWAMVKISS
jgi:hypothetical protein